MDKKEEAELRAVCTCLSCISLCVVIMVVCICVVVQLLSMCSYLISTVCNDHSKLKKSQSRTAHLKKRRTVRDLIYD